MNPKGNQGMIWGYKSSIHAVHYLSSEEDIITNDYHELLVILINNFENLRCIVDVVNQACKLLFAWSISD